MRIEEIDVSKINVGEQQLRYDPEDDSIIELAADIARHGLLQPIGVAPAGDGKYQLLWGSRRLAAFTRLRRERIPAQIVDEREDSVKTYALVENIQRQDLTLGEEVDAVVWLHDKEGLSTDQIATRLSKSRAWVLRRLAIPNLPPEVGKALFDGEIGISAAEEIARVEDEGLRRYVLSNTIQNHYTTEQVRALVQAAQALPENFSDAVEAAVAVASGKQQTKVMMNCALCGALRDATEMQIVRICKYECEEKNA